LDAAAEYLSLDEPDRSSHLWKYTPWRRVHPTGDIASIPDVGTPRLSSSALMGAMLQKGYDWRKG